MKVSFIFMISFLLTAAIIAPSVITLVKLDKDTAILIDFNEEEKNTEDKKELNEKDVFFHTSLFGSISIENTPSKFTSTYIDGHSNNTLEVFLPPPEHIS